MIFSRITIKTNRYHAGIMNINASNNISYRISIYSFNIFSINLCPVSFPTVKNYNKVDGLINTATKK